MKLKHILTHSILSALAFCSLYAHTQPNAQDPEKAPRPGQVVIPSSTTPQYAHAIPNQEQKRDGVFRKLQADTMVVNNTLTADTIHVQHFDVAQTTFENLDVLQTLTTKNLFVTSGAQITGQGTTQAPALRLLGLPNTPTPTDTILTIDGSGNVINSGATIGSLAGGTSSNVPGAVVQRNLLDGGFSAGTITALGLIGNLTGNVSGDVIGNVSGAASANVLKVGDTMSGQLRIADASDAALVLTGQGTTQAPALRLHGLPNTSTPTDTILTLDGSGNVINSGATIGALAGGTSSNVPNTLVLRDGSGNFATSAITLNSGTTGVAALNNVGSAGTGLYFPAAGQVALTAASTQQLVANSTGIGIGTTPFTQLVVSGPLSVAGNLAVDAGPHGIYLQGRYLYIANVGADTMSIVDVSNSSNPVIVGTLSGLSNPRSPSVQGRYAYVTNSDIGTMSIIDINNPCNPVIVGTLSGLTTPVSLYVQGRYAYILEDDTNVLAVVDISNPSNPAIVGTLGGINAFVVRVQGVYAYVIENGTAQMEIIDVSNPTSPTLAGTIALSDVVSDIVVQGRYAYLLVGQAVQVFDISNPTIPLPISAFSLAPHSPFALAIEGRYLYTVNNGSNMMSVLDVSDPTNPVLVRSLVQVSGGSSSLIVQGRSAYFVEDTTNTLHIVDLGGAYIQQLETGGLETGTLATRANCAIGNDLDVKGGATVGANLFVNGQITAMNVSGAATTPNTISPLCLVNVPTGTANALHVDASGYVTQTSSSRRFKENIVPLSAESDLLYTLTPVKYDFNAAHSGRKNLYGFIAEDVAGVYPSIVNYDGQGLPCNYVADTLHALTIKEVQKQKQKLDAHDGIIKALLITIASMQAQIATLQAQ